MHDPVRYGVTPSEKIASENEECRRIAREISSFGISERQRLMLIYILSLEIENVEAMKSISSTVRDVARDIFLIDNVDSDGV